MDIENATGTGIKCEPCPKFIEVTRLARAYVPIQKLCEVWRPEKALRHGTAFPELCMPYEPESNRPGDSAAY